MSASPSFGCRSRSAQGFRFLPDEIIVRNWGARPTTDPSAVPGKDRQENQRIARERRRPRGEVLLPRAKLLSTTCTPPPILLASDVS